MKDPESNILVREPDAGKPHVRFDEREVETARTAPPLDSTQNQDDVRFVTVRIGS